MQNGFNVSLNRIAMHRHARRNGMILLTSGFRLIYMGVAFVGALAAGYAFGPSI